MRLYLLTSLLALTITAAPALYSPAQAQEKVMAANDIEALFQSPDPQLHANKQVVYHIIRDLLEAQNWDLADKYLTEKYTQYNPNAASGRDAVVHYFTQVQKRQAQPIPDKIEKIKVVSVVAEDDLVVVAFARTVTDEKNPENTYTTTWFDMWQIKDGKADAHWDSALRDGKSPNITTE